ncbi:hypothetical protein BT63DRAFT_317457 [Microthyrium microscopicum]|uniref:Uncharacterized protein n=1 Tax=Microthyrium microscopicum TaxID=703497 RepID=A0A6A6U3M8_9PEZI|nr:hypothetical protein BT63DRAFT_317457 [Microthyrium microscopicum]
MACIDRDCSHTSKSQAPHYNQVSSKYTISRAFQMASDSVEPRHGEYGLLSLVSFCVISFFILVALFLNTIASGIISLYHWLF